MKIKTPDFRTARFALAFKRSRINGFGVFAKERIPTRRLVIEYTGEKIKDAEGDRRFERMMRGKAPKHSYLFTVGRALLDGSVGGSGAEYINHSCQPNLITYEVRGHILLYSRRIIRPGEELTYDYRFAADAVLYPCHCGTRRCRGTINLLPKRTRRTVRN